MKKYEIESSPFLHLKGDTKVALQEVKGIEGDLVIVKKKYYQSGDYTKIMIEPELDLSEYFRLSNISKNLLYYIVHLLEYNTPTFKLKVKTASHLLKKDESSIYKAIKELIKNNVIAKTNTREIYWINHNKYYKGNYTFSIYAKTKK